MTTHQALHLKRSDAFRLLSGRAGRLWSPIKGEARICCLDPSVSFCSASHETTDYSWSSYITSCLLAADLTSVYGIKNIGEMSWKDVICSISVHIRRKDGCLSAPPDSENRSRYVERQF